MRYLILFCLVFATGIVHAQPTEFCRTAAHYAQMSIYAVRYGTPKLVWKYANPDVYKCDASWDECRRRTAFLDVALTTAYSPEIADRLDMVDDDGIQQFATRAYEVVYRKCLRY